MAAGYHGKYTTEIMELPSEHRQKILRFLFYVLQGRFQISAAACKRVKPWYLDAISYGFSSIYL
jgi:hypothetical protein